MTAVFADTFFFLALVNGADAHHDRARQANHVDRPMVTSGWVLIELADHLCDAANRHLYGEIVEALQSDPRFEIVPVDQGWLDTATAMYRQRADKNWSLTDCTSFVLMQQRGMTEALTGDHHFEQAGFAAMLK